MNDSTELKSVSSRLREFVECCRNGDSRVGINRTADGFSLDWASHTGRHDGAFYPLSIFTEAADAIDLYKRLADEMQTLIEHRVQPDHSMLLEQAASLTSWEQVYANPADAYGLLKELAAVLQQNEPQQSQGSSESELQRIKESADTQAFFLGAFCGLMFGVPGVYITACFISRSIAHVCVK